MIRDMETSTGVNYLHLHISLSSWYKQGFMRMQVSSTYYMHILIHWAWVALRFSISSKVLSDVMCVCVGSLDHTLSSKKQYKCMVQILLPTIVIISKLLNLNFSCFFWKRNCYKY